MRIAHITDSFSPLSETFIYDYITELERSSSVENHVVTFSRQNIKDRPFENVHLAPLPSRWHPERAWEKVKQHLHLTEANDSHLNICRRRILPNLKCLNPDVIHAHFGPIGVMIAPIAEALGIPLVTTFYGYDISSLPRDLAWRKRYQNLFRSLASATVLSQDMRQRLIEVGASAEKIRIVHLAKRLEDYTYGKARGPIKTWVSVGRLVEKKGHLDCIKAFDRVCKDKDYVLCVIGEGEDLPVLKEYVRQNGLCGQVKILGSRPHLEVKQLMAKSDAFILCSKTAGSGDSEGTPTVLMEAQALGLPCVSTRHSGIPEVLPEENHWLLAEEGNIDQIADCIRKLTACSTEQLETISRAGRDKVESDFNLALEVKKLIEVYENIQPR
jgi:colanic acid/amylovoran biosynthesis glycosyltransferase